MSNVDIANETRKVGNALSSVRIDQMIVNLAKGIAEGQFMLDQQAIKNLKIMGVPDMVSIGDEKLSMLEAGFVPSFYQFVDTIIELKMEVKIREEKKSSQATKVAKSGSVTAKASAKWGWGSASVSATGAYSKTVDTKHSQTFSQDLSAQSLMRTKLVPVPAPEPLLERISIVMEDYRARLEAERKAIEEQFKNETDPAKKEKSIKGAIEDAKKSAMAEILDSLSITD